LDRYQGLGQNFNMTRSNLTTKFAWTELTSIRSTPYRGAAPNALPRGFAFRASNLNCPQEPDSAVAHTARKMAFMNGKPDSARFQPSRQVYAAAGIRSPKDGRRLTELHAADRRSHRMQEADLAQWTSFG
jgi:hypothetical protein